MSIINLCAAALGRNTAGVIRTCEWQQVMILHNYFYTTSILLHLIQTLPSSSEEICY